MNVKRGLVIGSVAGCLVLTTVWLAPHKPVQAGVARAFAAEKEGDDRGRISMRPGEVLKELNLSAEQKSQLKEILTAERDQVRATLRDLVAARMEMRDAIQRGADEKTVRDKARVAAGFDSDMAVIRARLWSKANKILTPDQERILENRRAEAEAQWQERLDHFINKFPDFDQLEQ